MPLPAPKTLMFLTGLMAALASQGQAQEPATALAETLAPRVLFVTSGGYWEDASEPAPDETAPAAEGAEAAPDANATAPSDAAPISRGYYRLVAIRGEDNKSQVQLQQIALTPAGPELALSVAIDEINSLGGYVTDIRPEDSTGASSTPGFAAYVYLKMDPAVVEPDTWAVYIDEFGDIRVEQSSN